jgi:CRP/FNR family transcriptional regulator, cyclic AMP receptor protein
MLLTSPEDGPPNRGLPEPLSSAANHGFLASLPTELAAELINSAPLVHYPQGSLSAPTGQVPWAAIVVTGVLRQYLPARDGRQVTIRYVGAGEVVGSPNTDSRWFQPEIEAVEPSDLLHLDTERIERAARRSPELSAALTQEVTNRLVHIYRVLASTAFATVRSRVARDLLERAGTGGIPRSGARVRVTQQALADATGSVREVVARALRELRLQGIIETKQSGVTILRIDALIEEAGSGP